MVFWAALLRASARKRAMPRCSVSVPRGSVLERKSTRRAFGGAQGCLKPRQGASESVKLIRSQIARQRHAALHPVSAGAVLTAGSRVPRTSIDREPAESSFHVCPPEFGRVEQSKLLLRTREPHGQPGKAVLLSAVLVMVYVRARDHTKRPTRSPEDPFFLFR